MAARLVLDGESGYDIGRNLAGLGWSLVVLPFCSLPFGVIGAAAGVAWRRRRVVA